MPLIPKQEPPYYETGSATEGIKYYKAILSQDSTNAPTVTVLQNTLGGDLVWTYSAVGIYIGTLTAAFPANKLIALTNVGQNNSFLFSCARNNDNSIYISTRDPATLNDENDNLNESSLYLEVHP